MSADSLFRVRLKQPFGLDSTVKSTFAVDQNPDDNKNPDVIQQ